MEEGEPTSDRTAILRVEPVQQFLPVQLRERVLGNAHRKSARSGRKDRLPFQQCQDKAGCNWRGRARKIAADTMQESRSISASAFLRQYGGSNLNVAQAFLPVL